MSALYRMWAYTREHACVYMYTVCVCDTSRNTQTHGCNLCHSDPADGLPWRGSHDIALCSAEECCMASSTPPHGRAGASASVIGRTAVSVFLCHVPCCDENL